MLNQEAFIAFQELIARHVNKFDKNDKMQMIAFSAMFDSEFIREWFLHYGDNYYGSWFFHPPICILNWAAIFLLDHRGALPNFKLETLCKSAGLGWDDSKAHNARYDIDQTIALYRYLKENTRVLGE